MPIKTMAGDNEADSLFATRPWVYGADGLVAYRGLNDSSLVIMAEPKAKTVTEEFQFSYVGT